MPNTVTQTTLVGAGSDKVIVRHIHIVSDGTEESNTIVYDNSTLVNDPLKGNLMGVMVMGADSLITLAWDQTTDFKICALNPVNSPKMNFRKFGGINNPGGTGATGDILLSTANLDTGDEVTIILWIHQN